MRGSWRPNRTATYWPPLLWPSVFLSRSPDAAQPEVRGPTLLGAGFLYRILLPTGLVSKLTDFLSSPSYIIVQSPTQYLPITSHRNVSLPPSLEWHVWSSSSGNNCHAVHRSLSSGASVFDYTAGFYLVPYCQPSPSKRFLPITGHRIVSVPLSLEWHVWPGRRSIYNKDGGWNIWTLDSFSPSSVSNSWLFTFLQTLTIPEDPVNFFLNQRYKDFIISCETLYNQSRFY